MKIYVAAMEALRKKNDILKFNLSQKLMIF